MTQIPAGPSSPKTVRRREVLLGTFELGLRGVAGAFVASLVVPMAGCAIVKQGDHDLKAFFIVPKTTNGVMSGYTEMHLSEEADPEDEAVLKRVILYAPEGVKDLTFIQSLIGHSTSEDGVEQTIVQGSNFPRNDTIGQLEVVYDGNLRPFFKDGKAFRVVWQGQIDPTFPIPQGGLRVDALVTVEVL